MNMYNVALTLECSKKSKELFEVSKVVIGGDSCSKGHGFESQHRLLDGHFSHLFVVKIVIMFV